jgi:hypothetical protein
LFRIVAIAALLLGISPFGVAQVTRASNVPLYFSNPDSRNVTSIAKNQIYPLKIELMRDPCAAAFCIDI